jgi:hypothetical protein
MMRILAVLFGGLLLMGVVGCSQYDDDYQFTPRPALADIPATQPTQPPPISAQATVVGVRYDDQEDHIPPSIEIRLSIDNNSGQNVYFDPMAMQLTTGALLRFPPPIVHPPTPINFAPGQSVYLTAYFPFPANSTADGTDLSTLQFRWQLQIGNQPVGQIVNFTRVSPYYYNGGYYGPYWYAGPPVFYGGVVVVHRRW